MLHTQDSVSEFSRFDQISMFQSDVPVDLLDVEKNSAVVSYSACDPEVKVTLRLFVINNKLHKK